MNSIRDEILSRNAHYAEEFSGASGLDARPRKRIAVLTCKDCRLDPKKFLGLEDGDAHIIRNGGGRASDDAIRSLIVSYKFLGTREWFVIHHTDCGMASLTDEQISLLLEESLEPAERIDGVWVNPKPGGGSSEGRHVRWLTIDIPEGAVYHDVARIRHHPLVPKWIRIHGFIYDVQTGRLIDVPAATEVGMPTVDPDRPHI
ncbi:MAG: carbonic anhydrase [Candidatus Eisenbacteria bacterium]|uniref:Carbonic anhydrase n=1 Tax=Eiseniibacteriota bacterium TaxID=2212470 RepID=A0A956NDK0_UNCEI|nr:carbonic anhydrase [Candidatus Eisenbacteria bacterium]